MAEVFNALPETYVIFITENDVIGDGKAVYPIERYIKYVDSEGKETYRLANDGNHIRYVNGAYRNDDPIGRLMHDFACTSPDDMNYKVLAERSRFFKESKEGVETMCKAIEEMLAREREEITIVHIKNMMENLKLTAEQAMAALNIAEADRPAVLKNL